MAQSVDAERAAPLQPEQHLIVFNIGKKSNVGTIARCCTAFGAASLCVIGSRQINTFGAHGADAHVHMRHFPTLQDCCTTLREQQGCSIVGIEIMESARAVHTHPFTGPTAFMLGNEGQGLSASQKSACDSFVYISQHGAGTASLNVAAAASIVLHHFALWASYSERQREGEKFVVAPRPQLRSAKRCIPLTAAERAAARERDAPMLPGDEVQAALQLQDLLQPGEAVM